MSQTMAFHGMTPNQTNKQTKYTGGTFSLRNNKGTIVFLNAFLRTFINIVSSLWFPDFWTTNSTAKQEKGIHFGWIIKYI